jgi:lipoteichoic acid synthase
MVNGKNDIRRIATKFSGPSQSFLALTAGLIALFIFLRIYEFIIVSTSHNILSQWFTILFFGTIYDFIFVFTVAAIMVIPFLLISLWNLKVSRLFFVIISGLLLVVHIGLVSYFVTTNVPLGADFYGYSWKEINLTVSSSTGIDVWTFIPFIFFLSLAAAVFILSKKIHVPQILVLPFFSILFIILLLRDTLRPTPDQFEREAEFNLTINKSDFFLQKSWDYFSASENKNFKPNDSNTAFRPYPLFRTFPYHDVLSSFFKQSQQYPNLVFIIVEGLGRDFIGEGAAYGGFTPFIDSLTRQSLYWENFLSTAGRTFNALPSIFGSLPYGTNGFMEMGERMPAHQTLISLLKEQGYYTSFFYGSSANFDLMDVFLVRQGIDYILDKSQFGAEYRLADSNDKGFSWGYDDGDLFMHSLEIINSQNKSPRLDIYLTISTHEPFSPPNRQSYWKRFDERLALLAIPEEKKQLYRDYKEVFSTLLYFDDALRQLFIEYKKRGDFERTIFFITGDHRLIPIPLDEQIGRFHIPLIIYSPMVREPRKFSSISTHSDVTPTVLAFLHSQYNINIPEKASWLSSGIDTAQDFRNIHSMPLMRNKNELIDYVDGLYCLAGDQTYKLQPGLIGQKIDDGGVFSILQQKLDRFKKLNDYVCKNNRLFPDTIPSKHMLANPQNDSAFASLKLDNLSHEQLFEKARQASFNKQYDVARIICKRLLQNSPRNSDYLMLIGRSYAWEGKYDLARSTIKNVLTYNANNTDALSALVDLELWSGNNERAFFLSDSSLASHPVSIALLVRKSKALTNLGRTKEAKTILRKALEINPDDEEVTALRKRLGF